MSHTARRSLMLGILGAALLLALLAGVAAGQGGKPAASVPDGAAVGATGHAVAGGQYRLSPPSELDSDSNAGAIPAGGGPAVYRVSAPNERDPEGGAPGGAAPASDPAYRVGPPNEADPAGP